IFRIAKQISRQNRDVKESCCNKDKDGTILTDESKERQTLKEKFDGMLNEEFAWDRSCLSHTEVVCGPSELISVEEAKAAVSAMKAGKAAGPSGVVSEMIKAAGEAGVRWMTDLF